MSRLERIDTLVSDQVQSGDLSKQLKDLALDRAERWWPSNNMRLQESLGTLISDAGDVTQSGEPLATIEYARRGVVFAALTDLRIIELRLMPDIAEAAMRTPSAGPSARGEEWLSFAPPEWDQHATDRLESWFRVAWRLAEPGR